MVFGHIESSDHGEINRQQNRCQRGGDSFGAVPLKHPHVLKLQAAGGVPLPTICIGIRSSPKGKLHETSACLEFPGKSINPWGCDSGNVEPKNGWYKPK